MTSRTLKSNWFSEAEEVMVPGGTWGPTRV